MKIQLRKPFFPNKSIIRIQNQIKNVMKSGQLTLGENVKIFEEDFAKYFHVKFAVAVSSATEHFILGLYFL